MYIFYALGSALFAGFVGITAKLGLKNVNSHLATALRTVVVLIFAWIVVWVKGVKDFSAVKENWLFLALSGLSTGLSWIFYFRALAIGEVNKVVSVDKCSTALTMLLAIIFLGEEVTAFKLVGMAVTLIGTFLMIEKRTGTESKKAKQSWIFYAVLSCIFAACTSVLAKVGLENIDSNLASAVRTGVVLIMAWIIVFAAGKTNDIKTMEKKDWIFIAVSGILTGISWLLYFAALSQGEASIVAPIDKLSIVVTVIFSVLVFKEKMSARSYIGFALIVAGTVVLMLK